MERQVPTENNKLATNLYFGLLWVRLGVVSPTELCQLYFQSELLDLHGQETDSGLHYLSVGVVILRDLASGLSSKELHFEKGTLVPCWWECKLVQPVSKILWKLLKKLKIEQPYDPAIPLLGIYPLEKKKTLIQKDTRTPMFTAALFTIAKIWMQPECPSTDEWMKKMWHIYTMEYYSAIKRNEIELFVVRWMDLESAIQSEVSQKDKNKYHMLTHIYGL